MKRSTVIGVICMFLLFLGAVCMDPSVNAADRKILKVGLLSSLSGPASVWGIGWRDGALLGADWVNEEGIKVGDDVYNIKLIIEDDKFTSEGGKRAYDKLIYKEGVKFILGPWSSAAAMAGTPAVEENRVLNLAGSYGGKVVKPEYKYLWRACTTSGEITGALVSWLKNAFPNVRRVAILGQNNEYGWSCCSDQEVVFEKYGIEVVATLYHEPKMMDYYSILKKLIAKGPEVIATNSAASEMAMQIKQARELGYTGLIMGPCPGPISNWEGIVGKEAIEGYFDPTPCFTGPKCPDVLKRFHRDYVAKYGKFDASGVVQVSYSAVLKQIIEKAQSLDPTEIIKTLPSSSYEHIYGNKAYWGGKKRYGTAQNLIYPTPVSMYTNGKMVFQGMFDTPEPLPHPRLLRK